MVLMLRMTPPLDADLSDGRSVLISALIEGPMFLRLRTRYGDITECAAQKGHMGKMRLERYHRETASAPAPSKGYALRNAPRKHTFFR